MDRIRNAIFGRKAQPEYTPTYHESGYQRSIVHRLTPVTWFLVAVVAAVVLAIASVVIARAIEERGSHELLSDRLGVRVDLTVTPELVWLVTPVTPPAEMLQVVATPRPTRPPTATPDPNYVPWARQIITQPDGTLLAPRGVIDKAITDLGAYYDMQRDMSIDDYLARREEILTTYFTDAALEDMHQLEAQRDLYAMTRAGRYSIEIRHFSPDGLTARAGVITREWVSDLYDVISRQLVAKGRVKPDTLTIMLIRFDTLSGRWKFARVEEVTELQQ
jgi:hypothetical protein